MRLLLLLHVCVYTRGVVAQTTCGFEKVDLSAEFRGQNLIIPTTDGAFDIHISPCEDVSTSCATGLVSTTVYRTPTGSADCFNHLGIFAGGQWSYTNGKNANDGVRVQYTNGAICGVEPPTATVDFICDSGASPTADGPNLCDYDIVIPSATVCDARGGLSAGWIFTIVVLVSFTVYCIVGVFYNVRQNGKSGMESMPNIDFWRELPNHAKAGCQVTWGWIRGPRSEYESTGTPRSGDVDFS